MPNYLSDFNYRYLIGVLRMSLLFHAVYFYRYINSEIECTLLLNPVSQILGNVDQYLSGRLKKGILKATPELPGSLTHGEI